VRGSGATPGPTRPRGESPRADSATGNGATRRRQCSRPSSTLQVRRDKTGMLLGMKEPYKKGGSESTLAPSLAGVTVRRESKRRQGCRWADVLSKINRSGGAASGPPAASRRLLLRYRPASMSRHARKSAWYCARSALTCFVYRPCFNCARRIRSIPSAIFGPVLSPPCSGTHRPFSPPHYPSPRILHHASPHPYIVFAAKSITCRRKKHHIL
jgi:hypothetical protein